MIIKQDFHNVKGSSLNIVMNLKENRTRSPSIMKVETSSTM